MNWLLSNRCDPAARKLADRHYNRQSIGATNFVPPGRCVVLITRNYDALWVTSWPFAEYVKHEWGGAWICSCFRNESTILSSTLIREAVAVTRYVYGDPPTLGMVTFVDTTKTRKKRDPGRCYRKAGFRPCGFTKGGLVALQCLPEDMPDSCPPESNQLELELFV